MNFFKRIFVINSRSFGDSSEDLYWILRWADENHISVIVPHYMFDVKALDVRHVKNEFLINRGFLFWIVSVLFSCTTAIKILNFELRLRFIGLMYQLKLGSVEAITAYRSNYSNYFNNYSSNKSSLHL